MAVSGDRAHYLADLASNIAAVIGVGVARVTGDPRFDAAAGLFVAAWLLWGAVKVFRDATDHLMDRELDMAERQQITDAVLQDPADPQRARTAHPRLRAPASTSRCT